MKTVKYAHLSQAHLFNPVAIETTSAVGPCTTAFLELVREEDLPGDRRNMVVCLFVTAPVSSSAEGGCSSSDGNLQSSLETIP